MNYIIPLNEITSEDKDRVGNKAYNLSLLSRMNINVPLGFCITTSAFEDFVKTTGLYYELDQIELNHEHIYETIGKMRIALESEEIPSEIVKEIIGAYNVLNKQIEEKVACRSSSMDEDLSGVSFAGQYVTQLEVQGIDMLLAAVKECWISLLNDNVIVYRKKMGFSKAVSSMAVVVQLMVIPEYAGVAFSFDPSEKHNAMVFEVAKGLGDAVVSGCCDTQQYFVDRDSARLLQRDLNIANSASKTQNSTAQRQNTGHSLTNDLIISNTELHELWNIIKYLENQFESNVDVEFAMGKVRDEVCSHMYILQCRPQMLYKLPQLNNNIKESDKSTLLASGIGVSKGIYTGVARQIGHGEKDKLDYGEVLVAKYLTVDLYPAIYRSNAIIVESNSLISHTCTVARELGIPCIIGIKDLFPKVADGTTVQVDGTSGNVYSVIDRVPELPNCIRGDIPEDFFFMAASRESLSAISENKLSTGIFDIALYMEMNIAISPKEILQSMAFTLESFRKKIKHTKLDTFRIWVPSEDEINRIFINEVVKVPFEVCIKFIIKAQIEFLDNLEIEPYRIVVPYKQDIISFIEDDKIMNKMWLDFSQYSDLRVVSDIIDSCGGICINSKQVQECNGNFGKSTIVIVQDLEQAYSLKEIAPWIKEYHIISTINLSAYLRQKI